MPEGRTPIAEDPAVDRAKELVELRGDALPSANESENNREEDPARAEAMAKASDAERTRLAQYRDRREADLKEVRERIADSPASDDEKAAKLEAHQGAYDAGHVIHEARMNQAANQLEESAGAQYDKDNTTWNKFKRGLSRFFGRK